MHILFATVHPYPPELIGGLQRSSAALATRLQARGHTVSMLCGLIGKKDRFGQTARVKQKLSRMGVATDHENGFATHRAWFPWQALPAVVRRREPDVIVVLAGQPVRMGLAAMTTGKPIVMMVQNVEFSDHGGDIAQLSPSGYVANSEFTSRTYHRNFGVRSDVIHPMIDQAKYRTDPTGKYVTFVNPHPLKGVDIALEVARRCPDIRFQFIGTWTLDPDAQRSLHASLAALPNIRYRPPVKDMRHVYGASRAVLVPSRWKEAFGRVVVEAHCSGLPVIGSNRGGIPEAVGAGGILIDPDGPIDPWVDAVRKVWSHKPTHARLSSAARKNLERPAFNIQHQTEAWERVLLKHAGGAEQRVAAA